MFARALLLEGVLFNEVAPLRPPPVATGGGDTPPSPAAAGEAVGVGVGDSQGARMTRTIWWEDNRSK